MPPTRIRCCVSVFRGTAMAEGLCPRITTDSVTAPICRCASTRAVAPATRTASVFARAKPGADATNQQAYHNFLLYAYGIRSPALRAGAEGSRQGWP